MRARDAGAFRRGDGRHHVFDIVHAMNFHGAEREAFFDAAVAPNDFVGRGKNTFATSVKPKETTREP